MRRLGLALAIGPFSVVSLLGGCDGSVSLGEIELTTRSTCAFAPYDLTMPRGSQSLDFATFWEAGAEAAAVDVLRQWASTGPFNLVAEASEARSEQLNTLYGQLGGNYDTVPDVFQVNGGADVLQWVKSGGRDSELCSLNSLDRNAFRDRYFDAALDPVTCSGTLYALPIGIHQVNRLYFNPSLIELAEEKIGSRRKPADVFRDLDTAERFVQYLETLGELHLINSNGDAVTPMAIGTHPVWPLGILAFDNLMASMPGLYNAVWRGEVPPGYDLETELRRWLDLVQRIVAQTPVVAPLGWSSALKHVSQGLAIFTVIGDWASAELLSKELAGGDISSVIFPPTRDLFIYTPDSIAVPRAKDENRGAAAHYFLRELVDNKEVMLDFANQKWAIPTRSDLSRSDLSRLRSDELRNTYQDFVTCTGGRTTCAPLLAVSGYDPPPFTDPCYDEVLTLIAQSSWGRTHDPIEPTINLPPVPEVPSETGDIEDPRERKCEVAYPETAAEAEREIIRRLVALSKNPPVHRYCPPESSGD